MKASSAAARGLILLAALVAGVLGVAVPAQAATYHVTGADAQGLAVQSEPHVNHVIRYVPNGTALNVSCQVNDGDQVDGRVQYGRPFRTWDRLADGTWVYDWYTDTPTVATDGYSPGMAHCDSGSLPAPASGCVDWPSSKFLQTPLTSAANGGTGSVVANPHYGSDYHVNCDTTDRMNQYYAVDLVGMRTGDPVLSPGGAGTVKYAGWAPYGWESCGQYIIVDHGGGWWSVVCHLSAVYVRTGQTVTNNTIIGAVGATGTSEAHLHFSLMKNASITAAGGVYGGQSARPRHLYHLGCGGGYYDWISQGMQVCY